MEKENEEERTYTVTLSRVYEIPESAVLNRLEKSMAPESAEIALQDKFKHHYMTKIAEQIALDIFGEEMQEFSAVPGTFVSAKIIVS